MPLFTLLMDFKGGTYIRQVSASTPSSACMEWAKNLDTSEIYGLGVKDKNYLIEKMKNEVPVPINETTNTWCASALVWGNLILVTIIQTEQ